MVGLSDLFRVMSGEPDPELISCCCREDAAGGTGAQILLPKVDTIRVSGETQIRVIINDQGCAIPTNAAKLTRDAENLLWR
jgi:hypothetical protein